jgi:uncharacterized delta-60 repeat protein
MGKPNLSQHFHVLDMISPVASHLKKNIVMKKFGILYALLLFTAVDKTAAQAGSVDAAFGIGGIVRADIANQQEVALSLAIQSDGKIVAAGYSDNGGSKDFAVMRFKTTGAPDSTFGTAGKVVTPVGPGDDYGQTVLIQTDGKIVVTGYSMNGSDADFSLVRYLSNGALDATFGTGGKVTTSITSGPDIGWGAALQTDGKIVVGGTIPNGTGGDYGVLRYKTNGTLDSIFGVDGIAVFSDLIGDVGTDLKIQPDGKIVVCGYSGSVGSYDFSVIRLLTNGTPDAAFGTGGKATLPMGTAEDIGLGLAIQPDGKLVVAGYAWNSTMTKTDFALARFLTNGSPDPGFGTGGKVITAVTADYNYARGVMLQADGKIVLVGQVMPIPNSDFAIVRYKTNGSLDSSFNATGIVITDASMGDGYDVAYKAVSQSDGKIVVAGSASRNTSTVTDVDFALVRYISGLTLGTVDFSVPGNSVLVYPNPVADRAVLEYTLTQTERISVAVTDMQGRTVLSVLKDQEQQAGKHQQPFELPRELAPGTYLLTLSAENGSVQVKITR